MDDISCPWSEAARYGLAPSRVRSDWLTINAGKLESSSGRATSNPTGHSVAGGTQDSNHFRFAGGDRKVTKDLTLQYYYANLENYYKPNFLGLVHVLPLGEDQSFKTDLRYFDSNSDGKNGEAGYRFNNNDGYAKHPGEVDNKTWSAMFTYSLGSHSFTLGHQSISDDGGFVWLNQGSVVDGRNRPDVTGVLLSPRSPMPWLQASPEQANRPISDNTRTTLQAKGRSTRLIFNYTYSFL